MFHEEVVTKVEYVIKNDKNLYIKLSQNGKAETCGKESRQLFKYQKAVNILDGLPKTLKRLKFRVEAVPGTVQDKSGQKSILYKEYIPTENITRWVEKFGTCNDILKDAEKRKEELNTELSRLDKELSDILHKIEFENPKDLYRGWLVYKKIKQNRERRRMLKDELLIVSSVPNLKTDSLDRQVIQKRINGLSKRKYQIRVTDEVEDEGT